jgi:membrane protease subunit (stomatin/prohibitin family)
MGLWDKLTGELIDIVEWVDDSRDTLVYRFQRYNNEIKYGAKLTVREGQVAVFVNEGKLADVYQPGMYTLQTENMPIMSTLRGWKYGFSSPFKAEVYFVATRIFTDAKWGTKNPIMLRDPEFGMVRLRAFGNFAYRVSDPSGLIRNIVGTDGRFTVDELGDQLRDMLVARLAAALGEAKVAALDLAAHQDEVGKVLVTRLKDDFAPFGLEVVSLVIENISMPPEVEAAMDKRTSMGVLGNLSAYTQFQAANAIGDAAKNPGGAAGAGMGIGAGFAMGNQMAAQMAQAMGGVQQPMQGAGMQGGGMQGPPPIPQAVSFYAVIDGKQAGPFDGGALQSQLQAGQISRQTLVWKQGMAAWTAAGEVPELASLFAAVPPPLPPLPPHG